MRRQRKDFSGRVTPLFETMRIQHQAEVGEGGSPRRQDTILGDRPAQTRFKRVLALENNKTAQDLEITHLNNRFKRLETKRKSRTPQLKRRLFKVRIESSAENSLGDQEDASKQGRNDQDEGISFVQEEAEIQGRCGHDTKNNTTSTSITTASINITTDEPVTTVNAPFTTAGVSVSTIETSTPPTTITTIIEDRYLTIAQTLMNWGHHELAERLQAEEQGEMTIKERSKMFVELMNERKKYFARLRVEEKRRKPPTKAQNRNQMLPPQQKLDPKDKGKGKMVKPEKPLKKKEQIEVDEKVARNLEAQLQAELEEEERLARQKEEEAKIALIAKWNDVQAMMDADHKLAERLQAGEQGELTIEERSRLFVELVNERKKHFARLRAEEKQRKPHTKAQTRN
nr:hypothetical protein [Tanacetum cinerariifolium]